MVVSASTGQVTASITGSVTTSTSFPIATSAQTIVPKSNGKAGTAITAGTGALLYTVTAGKTLFIQSLSIKSNFATGCGWELRDGTTIAGAIKINGTSSSAIGGAPFTITFPTPIPFTTGLFLDISDNSTIWWNFVGFEQ